MVSIPSLWLPILLSAVFVFLVSWVTHMLLTYHRSNFGQIPNEDAVMAALREAGVGPGNYFMPHADGPKAMSSPEWLDKCKQGPVGIVNILPSGPPNMGKSLGKWFLFLLVVSLFVAYLAGRTQAPGAGYLGVFRVAGCSAFMAYSLGEAMNTIWKGQKGSTTVKYMFDGLVYALVTGGTFGWLWP